MKYSLQKIPAGKTLRATYNTTLKRVEKGNLEYLGEFEEVKIPYINFHIEKEFKQLEGRQVLNQDFKGYGIGKAMQIIDFGLNRVGINLESQAGAEFGFGHALGKT